MFPGASVSGFYFAHPQSKYFVVGKIGEDQVEDMARRRRCPGRAGALARACKSFPPGLRAGRFSCGLYSAAVLLSSTPAVP
jgi:hypothetical protein